MSTLTDLLKEIDSLREQLEKLKPIKAADEERLWKKFRLEWNYNSNHIEGNTLTYGQTELLLMFDKTTGDHEMREYEEMKAHDAVIHLVREFAKDTTRELSESDIRQWNKTILVRPFWSDAQTASGQPTKKKIIPGEYKKEPNSVRLQNGEMFHYASPEETPALMTDLVAWYRSEVKKSEMHPVELAALLHYKFVRIHPFDDSNGRTSRLLMNYELLRNDLPPVIIKSADKKNYLFALNKADVGDVEAFVEYIGNQLKWSLELNIKAEKGESVEEPKDIEKEIDVWKRSQIKNPQTTKSVETVSFIFKQSLISLFSEFADTIYSKFSDVFPIATINLEFSICGKRMSKVKLNNGEVGQYLERNYLDELHKGEIASLDFNEAEDLITLSLGFSDMKFPNGNTLTVYSRLIVNTMKHNYLVDDQSGQDIIKEYSQLLSIDEKNFILNNSLKHLFQQITQAQLKNSTPQQG